MKQKQKEELEENKNRIVETLNNYKIGIASIKATIGPTVTLYEIVPEAGVRISKIKSLEEFNRKLGEQNLGEVFISCFINLYPNTKKIFEIISFHKIE